MSLVRHNLSPACFNGNDIMRLIVAGSRSIENYKVVCQAIDDLVNQGMSISAIIDGAAPGVDTLASRYAHEHRIENVRIPADWKNLKKGAGKARNVEMAKMGDALLAIWDGRSAGTKHMIETAQKRGLKVFVRKAIDGDADER